MSTSLSKCRVEIPSVGTHTNCPCYQKNEEQIIRRRSFKTGDKNAFHCSTHSIVYMLEGVLRISVFDAAESFTIDRDEFIFLPIGTRFEYDALETGSVMIFALDKTIENIPECHTFRFKRDNTPMTGEIETGVCSLRANDRIRNFIATTLATEQDGLKCMSYARLLISQLMFLIQVYYTQEEYTRFYSAIVNLDVQFSNFVYRNWKKYPVAAELAMANSMTPQQFTGQFRKVFGETPGSWIRKRKMSEIYHDICDSRKTLKSIAFEHNLSMPNFIRYCRMNFGQTPGSIRSQLLMET